MVVSIQYKYSCFRGEDTCKAEVRARPGMYSDYSYVLNKSSPRVITPFVFGFRAAKNMPANKENEQVISAGVGEYIGQCGTYLTKGQHLPASCAM